MLSVLSGCQISLVFLSSSFLRYRHISLDPYDSEGMGVVLIISYVLLILVFFIWALVAKDDMSTSNAGMASKALKWKASREISETSNRDTKETKAPKKISFELKEIEDKGAVGVTDDQDNVEERQERSFSAFINENPMLNLEKMREGGQEGGVGGHEDARRKAKVGVS